MVNTKRMILMNSMEQISNIFTIACDNKNMGKYDKESRINFSVKNVDVNG